MNQMTPNTNNNNTTNANNANNATALAQASPAMRLQFQVLQQQQKERLLQQQQKQSLVVPVNATANAEQLCKCQLFFKI